MESTAAILLRLTRLTESSLIVTWYGENCGLIKTVAKGARRRGSPFAGKLDLFFGAEIGYARARRGDLHALREVAVSDWRQQLRTTYGSTLLAAYFCQMVEQAVEPEHPDAAMHDLLHRALEHVDQKGPSMKAFLHFEREVARLLGVANDPRGAAGALAEAIGRLPSTRSDLIERLTEDNAI